MANEKKQAGVDEEEKPKPDPLEDDEDDLNEDGDEPVGLTGNPYPDRSSNSGTPR
jgi:hypothetical protein